MVLPSGLSSSSPNTIALFARHPRGCVADFNVHLRTCCRWPRASGRAVPARSAGRWRARCSRSADRSGLRPYHRFVRDFRSGRRASVSGRGGELSSGIMATTRSSRSPSVRRSSKQSVDGEKHPTISRNRKWTLPDASGLCDAASIRCKEWIAARLAWRPWPSSVSRNLTLTRRPDQHLGRNTELLVRALAMESPRLRPRTSAMRAPVPLGLALIARGAK